MYYDGFGIRLNTCSKHNYSGIGCKCPDCDKDKQEMLEALIELYADNEFLVLHGHYGMTLSFKEKVKSLIERATGNPIDEVLGGAK